LTRVIDDQTCTILGYQPNDIPSFGNMGETAMRYISTCCALCLTIITTGISLAEGVNPFAVAGIDAPETTARIFQYGVGIPKPSQNPFSIATELETLIEIRPNEPILWVETGETFGASIPFEDYAALLTAIHDTKTDAAALDAFLEAHGME
jgi:hypothetical protein